MMAILGFGLASPAYCAQARPAAHPALVMTAPEVTRMRAEIARPGRFQRTYQQQKAEVDRKIALPKQVPIPVDAGGGVTHEIHRNNAQLMYDAAVIYQLTGEVKYAHFVRDMLSMYAELYPTLPLHPQRKTDSVISAGRLFWQNLNESVWLVYTIQAYDAVLPVLREGERRKIEDGILRPVALFLSEGSPHTFNTIHNHATWATTAVGMTGYVLGERDWVEKALYGSDKSGKGGFLRQLDELFSPDGYYTEGPYYQRYALLPFVTFAKAIETREPQRKIFSYRDGIILKAIDTTIQLSYNKLFFPINDAIKDKGIDTIELVTGVAIAYSATGDAGLLDVARRQDRVILTGDGMRVAQGLDARRDKPYRFASRVFRDGAKGDEGGLVVMREPDQALVFKATAQGMGHGHFDKLNWLFYDKGAEIVSDYGAARFLNIEAKFGGRYLPENKSYANQTVAHNTLVVDEGSHYGGKLDVAEAHHPELLYFSDKDGLKISAARVGDAYPGVSFVRTMAQLRDARLRQPIVVDILKVDSSKNHQFDLPLHYKGHLIKTNFALDTATQSLAPLGKRNGYQYLWLKARAEAAAPLSQVTWLGENGRFYTLSTLAEPGMQVLFTQIGANDPNFNLRNENAFILRIPAARQAAYVSVLEPHGGHDPVSEMTSDADSRVKRIQHARTGDIDAVHLAFASGMEWLLLLNNSTSFDPKQTSIARFEGKDYPFQGRFKLIALGQDQAREGNKQ
ncbi:heparinase II/III family protein [Massilia sp. IC2-477]|uniref:alginate lyase family protein n=1 Tax=Massilia sp. IC2-477 TaxID=2887198 RepID=UPI001D110070|nr:alginate lyase family protein [Massilia sp. IC2-477]MCC2956757.1 heparinase II/III family protein [Massilia sp. IC2-477]